MAKRSPGKPPLYGKTAGVKKILIRLTPECRKDIEKIAATVALPEDGKPSISLAVTWLWRFWKTHRSRDES